MENWVEQIFTLAGPNILIGGEEYEEVYKTEEVHEPLDENLAKRLQSLSKQVSNMQIEVLNLRKNYSKSIKQKLMEMTEKKNNKLKNTEITDLDTNSPLSLENPNWDSIRDHYKNFLDKLTELIEIEKENDDNQDLENQNVKRKKTESKGESINVKEDSFKNLLKRVKNANELFSEYHEQKKKHDQDSKNPSIISSSSSSQVPETEIDTKTATYSTTSKLLKELYLQKQNKKD